jgi:GNAT superfamily N-acetyltransferase
MAQPITIRKYEPGDEQGIVELLELVFDGWPHFDLPCTPLEHWKWKYLDNPYEKRTIPVVTVGDKVVCTNHGLTRRIVLFGKTFLCSQGTDLAVQPDYRRMGLYTKASEYKSQSYKDNGFSITWAVTGNPIVFDSNINRGRGGSPHKVSTLVRVNNVDLHFKMKGREDDFVKRMGAKVLKGSRELSQLFSNTASKDRVNYKFIDVNDFDTSFSSFWERARSSYDMIFDRNSVFMNWRYLDRRAGSFKIIAAKADRDWLGYIVYKVNHFNKNYPEAYIADILTLPERRDLASDLIEEVSRRLDREGLNATYSWAVEDSFYLDVLQRAGFLNSRYHPYFIFQNINLNSEWEELYKIKPGKMCVQFSDSDEV